VSSGARRVGALEAEAAALAAQLRAAKHAVVQAGTEAAAKLARDHGAEVAALSTQLGAAKHAAARAGAKATAEALANGVLALEADACQTQRASEAAGAGAELERQLQEVRSALELEKSSHSEALARHDELSSSHATEAAAAEEHAAQSRTTSLQWAGRMENLQAEADGLGERLKATERELAAARAQGQAKEDALAAAREMGRAETARAGTRQTVLERRLGDAAEELERQQEQQQEQHELHKLELDENTQRALERHQRDLAAQQQRLDASVRTAKEERRAKEAEQAAVAALHRQYIRIPAVNSVSNPRCSS